MTELTTRTPPNDESAEQAAIHAALTQGRIPDPLSVLRPADFYRPAHETIWAAMVWLHDHSDPCDANAVLARLMETKHTNEVQLLPELATFPWVSDPDHLAEIILDRAGRRHLITTHTRGLQRAYESEDPYEAQLQQSEAELAKVPARETGDVDSLLTLDEFLADAEEPPEWVLPELLARGERIIITGLEGLGKSVLCRQIGLCAAAGMDPFTGHPIPPQTVLMIDAENPKYVMQQRLRELRKAISAHGRVIDQTRIWIDRRPQGMDLSNPADRRWLQRRVKVVNPDLIVIGPAYKLHQTANDDKDEVLARIVTSVLDDIRGDAALVLEHHSGNEQGAMQRQTRPFGSSLWRRWPEFGRGLRPVKPPPGMTAEDVEDKRLVEFHNWRGDRDVRKWPRHMESGGDGLPWVETVLDHYRKSA